MGLPPIRKRLLTESVIDRLIPAITSGSFPPGIRLVENELASELGVSRIPVREAFRELSLQGILSESQGRGWRVADFDSQQILEVCDMRIALETAMLGDAIPKFRSDPSHFAKLDRELEDIRKAAAACDSDAMRQADVNFHRIAVSVSGNTLGQRIWEGLSRHVLIIFGLEIQSYPNFPTIVKQHETLRRYLAKGDPARLEEVMRDHITSWIKRKKRLDKRERTSVTKRSES